MGTKDVKYLEGEYFIQTIHLNRGRGSSVSVKKIERVKGYIFEDIEVGVRLTNNEWVFVHIPTGTKFHSIFASYCKDLEDVYEIAKREVENVKYYFDMNLSTYTMLRGSLEVMKLLSDSEVSVANLEAMVNIRESVKRKLLRIGCNMDEKEFRKWVSGLAINVKTLVTQCFTDRFVYIDTLESLDKDYGKAFLIKEEYKNLLEKKVIRIDGIENDIYLVVI